jgi:hypothetical protein
VPALPSSILEPLWVQVAALLPTRPDTHPLGCHRPRIADRVVFDKLIQVLVFLPGRLTSLGLAAGAAGLSRGKCEPGKVGAAKLLGTTLAFSGGQLSLWIGLTLEGG